MSDVDVTGIIDADVHPAIPGGIVKLFPWLSAGWQRRLEDRKDLMPTPNAAFRAPAYTAGGPDRLDANPPSGGPPASDAAYVGLDLMDRWGIDVAMLSHLEAATVVINLLDAEEAAALASAYNDCLYETWLPVDARFRHVMVVAPRDPELAAAEIRRHGARPGVVAVWVPTLNILIGDRFYRPILDAADEVGLPIFLHDCGARGLYVGGPEFAGGNPSSQLERYVGLHQFGHAHVASLIFEGTFERHPTMKVMFFEYGWTWAPSLLWRMDAAYRAGRASVPWVKRAPSETFREHIRFGTQPATETDRHDWLAATVEQMHGDRTLLFASDYPHYDGDDPPTTLRRVPDEVRRRILRDNAIETFGARLELPTPSAA